MSAARNIVQVEGHIVEVTVVGIVGPSLMVGPVGVGQEAIAVCGRWEHIHVCGSPLADLNLAGLFQFPYGVAILIEPEVGFTIQLHGGVAAGVADELAGITHRDTGLRLE